jgi:hypothetical protein
VRRKGVQSGALARGEGGADDPLRRGEMSPVGVATVRLFSSAAVVQFGRHLQPRMRHSQQLRPRGVVDRVVPHIEATIGAIVAVLHVRQTEPLPAQSFGPVIGARLMTHF